MGTWHPSAFLNRYRNRNDHHSRKLSADDAVFAEVEVEVGPVEPVLVVEAFVDVVVVAAAAAESIVEVDSDSDVVQRVDPTSDPVQVVHDPSRCSSCWYCYYQTKHLHCCYGQPGSFRQLHRSPQYQHHPWSCYGSDS